MAFLILFISAALAGMAGYSAQRASVCSVRAVRDAVERRDLRLLASFAKAAAWAMAFALPLGWAIHGEIDADLPPLGLAALAGGFLFGLGASLNNGCAISTISHLASGEGAMLMTLLGFASGALAVEETFGADLALAGVSATPLARPSILGLVVLGFAWIWALLELRHLIAGGKDERTRLLAFAAVGLGLCSGVLFALQGPWVYTAAIVQTSGFAIGHGLPPSPALLLLFAAVLAGSMLSALRAGRFRLRWQGTRPWYGHLGGGVMMGGGAALVPGGNDAVLLHALPLGAEHALPAFAAMLLGVYTGLALARVGSGATLRHVTG
ncbi:MAG TPA: YeeE/YedE thiosulfate transporter family protein [Alphaproteobacteria bacterium]|nr:YeeE/YedE thiosulfate transporter family protein [Alphaproteobacteria bacterium]